MKRLFITYSSIFVVLALLLNSCAGTKNLAEGEKLYVGADIDLNTSPDFHNNKPIKRDLEEFLQPEPNTSVLGMRPTVWVYQSVKKPKKDKGLKYWLKYKLGEPPVLFDRNDVSKTKNSLKESAINNGFFNATVQSDVHFKKRKASVNYRVDAGKPFLLQKIEYPMPEDEITKLIHSLKPKSILDSGARFDVQLLTEERNRIEQELKNLGYYLFKESHIIFEADSTVGDHVVDLFIKISEKAPKSALKKYSIRNVIVYTNFEIQDDTARRVTFTTADSVKIISKSNYIRNDVLDDQIKLKPGNIYEKEKHNITTNRLVGLNVFKFVNLEYKPLVDSRQLDMEIRLAPYEKKSLRIELEMVTKSDNYTGPRLSATFRNRNTLRGGEMLNLRLSAGFETQLYGPSRDSRNSLELGIEPSLIIPRFLLPFNIRGLDMRFVPQTRIHAAYRFLRRVDLFEMNSIELGLGYLWKEDLSKSHELNPIGINFLDLSNTTQEFRDALLNNPILRQSYEEQFILGSSYKYVINTIASPHPNQFNNFYFQTKVDLSGNIARLLQSAFDNSSSETGQSDQYKIFGLPYSQYVRGEIDFRYFRKLDENNKLASRIMTGVGYAFGNSITMPYIKQFSIGGSSSIRAFPARSLGPGSYAPNDTLAQIDQTADIKIETNLEYRFRIIEQIWGAVFADAGNIWTIREDENRPGSRFAFDRFIDEFAVGTGLGLRYDATYFVFRLDVAFPLRVPSRPPGDRWVVDGIALNKKEWRQGNLIFNIAIGYPF
jgi:outer membrane protein insertion porin family